MLVTPGLSACSFKRKGLFLLNQCSVSFKGTRVSFKGMNPVSGEYQKLIFTPAFIFTP